MNKFMTQLVVAALVTATAGCATSGLQRAGKLGDSGARLSTQAATSYVLANEQLERNAVMHCAARVLATKTPACDTAVSPDVAALTKLIAARAALYRSVGAYYTDLAGAAREDPVSLTEATNSSVSLAKSLATLMQQEFSEKTERAFRDAGVRLEALVQMIEERQRLKKLRESSTHMRAVLAVLIASYQVEREVLDSIGRVALAQRINLVNALADNKLLNVGPVSGRAAELVGAPVASLSKDSQAAWDSKAGSAFALFLTNEEERRLYRQRVAANDLIVSGLQALIGSHQQFESDRDVTAEDINVFAQRLAVLLAPQPKE